MKINREICEQVKCPKLDNNQVGVTRCSHNGLALTFLHMKVPTGHKPPDHIQREIDEVRATVPPQCPFSAEMAVSQ